MKNVIFTLIAFFAFVQAQAQLSESFEGAGVPTGWTVEGNWVHGNAAALSSQYMPYPEHTLFMAANDDDWGQATGGDGRLVSPPITLDATGPLFLTFDVFFANGDYQGANERLYVEITTNAGTSWTNIYEQEEGTDWANTGVDVTQYAGQTVQLAFVYDDGNEWNYGGAIDNVVIGALPELDGAILSWDGRVQGLTGQQFPVLGKIKNTGATTITSVDVTWADASGSHTATITGLNIASFEEYEFTHSDMYNVAEGTANVTLSISNVNGGTADANASNNSLSQEVSGVTPIPGKKVLAEEGTGTWCPWCIRGHVSLEYMHENYADYFVPVAVHNADPMAINEYDTPLSNAISGYPSSLVDRSATEVDPGDWENAMISNIATAPRVSIVNKAAYNSVTRDLDIVVDVTTLETLSGASKIVVVVTEDGVTGTGSDWGQANAYAGGANGPMGGYESLPSTVPASQMVYDAVARDLVTAFNGATGVIATSAPAGNTYTYTAATINIPTDWDTQQLNIVSFVLNASNRVLNVNNHTLAEAIANNSIAVYTPTANSDIRVFPTMANESTFAHLKFAEPTDLNIAIYNAIGQKVADKNYGSIVGEQVAPINTANFADGMYVVQVTANGSVSTYKVNVKH